MSLDHGLDVGLVRRSFEMVIEALWATRNLGVRLSEKNMRNEYPPISFPSLLHTANLVK